MQSEPVASELVLVGGGHSHVIVLRMLGMDPVPGLQVTLISPDVKTPYSGMLPGLIAGHYDEDDIHIDLVPLCRFAGARFIQARVSGIDPDAQQVICEGRPALGYDILSIDIGITPELESVSGARDAVIPVKPIHEFIHKWQPFLERALQGEELEIGFVGAGAGGVELCLAVHHRLEQEFKRSGKANHVRFHLFSDGSGILQELVQPVQQKFLKELEKRNIKVWPKFRVTRIEGKTLYSDDGDQAPLDEIFWVTSAAPQPWLAETGLKLDERGFIAVRDTLQTDNYVNVFATGDTAHVIHHPRPKAGVFAVRQGMPLAKNLKRLALGESPKPFKPQSEFLKLISAGDKRAIATRNGLSTSGSWVWRWKNWIDQRFMARFSDLPEMPVQKKTGLLAEFDDQMQCGGCGSKVSADLLSDVLDELGIVTVRDDAAIYQPREGETLLHTVDSFRSFLDDPYLFAKVAANHALSDIYAMGGEAVNALAIITVPYAKANATRNLLRQLLQGAVDQLGADNVELVGGHTSEGAELSMGFAVNGSVSSDAILGKRGAKAGNQLILTKPLGTGALFAADMQHKAKGPWIQEALESMCQSNKAAAAIFARHQATAVTDVTGFGLAGHLKEMLSHSILGVELMLDELPVLAGSTEVLEQGITSTLHQGNRNSAALNQQQDSARYELLFDPQTSGGLLASVDSNDVEACLNALRVEGYASAKVVGQITASGEIEIR